MKSATPTTMMIMERMRPEMPCRVMSPNPVGGERGDGEIEGVDIGPDTRIGGGLHHIDQGGHGEDKTLPD